jgi:hypothetical protein
MKLMKLNARGFSHEIVLVMLVVIVGIGGSAYLVLSHADSCAPVSSPMSSPASSPSCPVSNPASTPVSSVALAGSCGVNLNVSTSPKFGKLVQPKFTVYNTGDASFAPSVKLAYWGHGVHNSSTLLKTVGMAIVTVNPGSSTNATSALTYKVPLATSKLSTVTFRVTNTTKLSFTCAATMTLPHTKS